MTSTRIKFIFDEARQLASDQREACVRDKCAGDEAMAAEVLALLRDLEAAGEFLNVRPSRGESVGIGSFEEPGSVIGRYELLQLIGEGGFGSVFLAEQREPVRRTVALKIIKLGMDTRQVIARFEQERQALALMDHPNIAKVLDAGATEAGRPYFVMELVRGDPITQYCDANKLRMTERLEVFAQVCHAVQHAHQKGIIHRDIKPGNILVTVADGKPVPKIIDFGIAKATGPQLTDKTLVTDHRALIGTLEYMSPEQAEMGGVDIDTRADIYALGVLLYELITGFTPFDPQRPHSVAWSELQRIIREVDPPKPSTRLSAMKEALPDVALKRDVEPDKLCGLIRGDLDWIVMKCLEKARTRRYATADELAADIQRHLTGKPVSAAPPSTAYLVRKFVRRNRAAVTAAALVTVVGALGLVGTSTAFLVAREQRNRAVAAEERERRSAEQARRAAAESKDQTRRTNIALAFMDLGFGFAHPAQPGGKNLEVREMLRRAEKAIPERFTGSDEIQVRVTLGQRLLRMDESLLADAQLRKAVQLLERPENDDPLLMFEARSALYGAASSGVHDFALVARHRAVNAAVAYLAQVDEALGSAAAKYAAATMWQEFHESRASSRLSPAGRALLDAANAFPEMTSIQACAVTNVLHLPCPEASSLDVARACGPVLREWLDTAEQLGVDENTLLELRHSVLKLYVISDECETPRVVASDQLAATAKLLPADPWQRIRYDACAAHALTLAGDKARARQVLVETAGKARQSQNLNQLAARVLAHHVFAVAAKTGDRSLVTDSFGLMDEALIDALLSLPTWTNWNDADKIGPVVRLLSVQSVPDAGARQILGGAIVAGSLWAIHTSLPDAHFLFQRFVEFVEPDEEAPTTTYAHALFRLAKSQSEMGDWMNARHTYERGVESFITAASGETPWFAAKGRFLVGSCQAALGAEQEGLALMRENLQVVRDRFGDLDPVTMSLQCEYYAWLVECGERDEANELLRTIFSKLRSEPPEALDYAPPLLRLASHQLDLDASTLELVGQLAHGAAKRRRHNPLTAEPLLTELAVLLAQNKSTEASSAACAQLRTALVATPLSRDELATLTWGVASTPGLSSEAYKLMDECAAVIKQLNPAKHGVYEQQLFSIVELRHGRFQNALTLASRSDEKWIEATGRGLPDSAGVRACALAHLKRWEEARTNLRDARIWSRDRMYVTPFVHEAEDLIGDH